MLAPAVGEAFRQKSRQRGFDFLFGMGGAGFLQHPEDVGSGRKVDLDRLAGPPV